MALTCYRCHEERMVKNGISAKGYQKYRCTNCGHCFTSKNEFVGMSASSFPRIKVSAPDPAPTQSIRTGTSQKNKTTALGWAAFGFIGIAGLHCFYVGRKLRGVLYLLTFGFLFIGTIIDIILIISGHFKDADGCTL